MKSAVSRLLCSRCLSRQFQERMKSDVPEAECKLCRGIFLRLGEIGRKIIGRLEVSGEINTFSVGTVVPKAVESAEEEIWGKINFEKAEGIKTELNREIGKWIEKNSRYRFDRKPDARVLYNVEKDKVEVEITPLFVFGKYRKLKRGIRQTKKWEEEAVEGLIEPFFLKATGGDRAILHGHGREDKDVLMLGEGRPFISEIRQPAVRRMDLRAIQKAINKSLKGRVAVTDLKRADRNDIEVLKRAHFDKEYVAIIETDAKIDRKMLKKLQPTVLLQKTPTRVLNRRADLVRKKRIISVRARLKDSHHATLAINAGSGTYIKEYISGDGGRTRPSVAELLGTPTKCIELNVLKVNSGWLEDWW